MLATVLLRAYSAPGRATTMRLETERLALRLPEERDLDALARMHADEAHMRYMGGALDRETTWRHIAMMLGHWQIRGYGLFAVEDRRDGTFLGRVEIGRAHV